MNPLRHMMRWWTQLIAAFQFLTRIPMPSIPYAPDTLSRAVKFFPVVGLVLGASASFVHARLIHHVGQAFAALLTLCFLVMITGCLHEDGLADTADGLFGGRTREKRLEIMRDSRIGSYGAASLFFLLGARWMLLATLPVESFTGYVVCGAVLSRWTVLPLGSVLPAAQTNGQGSRIAGHISIGSLTAGSLISLAVATYFLRLHAILPIAAVFAITALTGLVYRAKIGGTSGDCFGATIQLAEIAVYVCGVWHK